MILDIQDIINSVSVPTLIKDEFIKKGTFDRLKNGDLQACVGGFSIAFPVEVDGIKWAFRCWHHTLDNDQARIKLLSAELKKVKLPYFIDFEYEDKGIIVNGAVYPTTRMKWINGRDIKDYICYNKNNRHKLFELASNFFAMTQDLHRLSIAHGDLQHENIMVNPCGKIFLIDYDSMYVPALSYMNSKNSTNGKDGYQHPARENCVYSNPTLDYFSEVVILTSILAIAHNPGLIDKYDMDDSDTMLFKRADFRSFTSSKIYSDLYSMGEIFVVLLNVFSSYLRKRDITKLEPLELAVNKANPTNAISIADYLKNAESNLLKEAEAERLTAIKAEENAWADACRLNSASGFSSFLIKYPYSKYKDTANKRLKVCQESENWGRAKASNTIAALDDFIKNYPDSVYIAEAKTIILNIRTQLEEDRVWKAAQDTNTIESYKSYLNRYPYGQYALTAKNKIDELKGSRRGVAFVLIIIFIIIAIIASTQTGADHDPIGGQTEQQQLAPKVLQIPPYSISGHDLSDLESKTEWLINAMEVAKSVGDSRDANMYSRAGRNLDDLKKYDSKKYKALNDRYKAL